jgi:hypothetical protein
MMNMSVTTTVNLIQAYAETAVTIAAVVQYAA